MTIQNETKFLESIWDWKILEGALPAGVYPSDCDGVLERRGQLLFIEVMSPTASLSRGQHRLLDTLAKHGAVLIVWGIQNLTKCGYATWTFRGKTVGFSPFCLEKFRQIISDWWKWAS